MKKKYFSVLFFLLVCLSSQSYSQVFVDANGTTDPYNQLNAKGWYVEETTLHPGFKHITQTWDGGLMKYVFNFIMHRDIDGDGAERVDRQRLEIKTYGPSPENMKGFYGETLTNRWKFKLDSGFQPTTSFCHIHQLKASDGTVDNSNPLITITPRKSSPDKLQLIFIAPVKQGSSVTTYLMEVPLAPFLGTWVEAYEKVKFHETGSYELIIKRVADDSVLFSYSNNNIALWRDTTHASGTFIRPKYGIYRSLGTNFSQVPNLRDETVLFDDYYLAKGTAFTLPDAPTLLTATAISGKRINLEWTSASISNGQFRIDKSSDGQKWSYYAASKITSYADTGLTATTKYYYRVRAENAFGNSGFSNTANATTTVVQGSSSLPDKFAFQNYPNPFNPGTELSYSLNESSRVQLTIYDMLGREVDTIIKDYQNAGMYHVVWNAVNSMGARVSSGTYLARLTTNKFSKTIKLLLMK